MPGNFVRFTATLKDEVTGSVNKINNSLDKVGVKGGNATKAMSKLSVATGGLITPQTIAAAGALALAGALVQSVRAAVDEEKNIGRLDAALKANIPAWNGNTKAIESTIKAREELAFSDDDLRDSLSLLVAATHDVNKAFEIQQTAMDLARFKGISLQDASEALTKVEAGSYRILKSLGIVLKDGATQTEALAAVQAVAAGQAEKYGESTAGALDKVAIKTHDLEEALGKGLVPVVKVGADVLSRTVEILGAYGDAIGDVTVQLGIQTQAERDNAKATADANQIRMSAIKGNVATSTAAAETLKGAWATTMSAVVETSSKTTGTVVSQFNSMSGRVKEDMNATRDSVKSAINALVNYTKDRLTDKQLTDILTGKGSLGRKLQKGLKDSRPDVRAQAEAIRDDLIKTLNARAEFTVHVSGTSGGRDRARAEGGPVKKGVSYIVGEREPEIFVPKQDGTIIPSLDTELSGGRRTPGGGPSFVGSDGAASGQTIIFNYNTMYSSLSVAEKQRFANDVLGELTRVMRQNHVI